MNFVVLRMVLAVAVSAVLSLTANAQAPYPNQGIRFIVPYAPGGLPDTVARIVGQHLQERIGQSVVIENRASGGAVLAVGALMGAPADGYTFLVTDGGIVSTNPALLNFDLATIVGLFARPGVPQAVTDRITAEAIAARIHRRRSSNSARPASNLPGATPRRSAGRSSAKSTRSMRW